MTHTREFGNSVPTLDVARNDEFFADVSRESSIVRAVADIPGASKEDIDLTCTDKTMTISAEVRGRRVSRTLAMPCDIDPESAKADFNNGVLEVTANIRDAPLTEHRIEIS
jgi:HSP20 family protein